MNDFKLRSGDRCYLLIDSSEVFSLAFKCLEGTKTVYELINITRK